MSYESLSFKGNDVPRRRESAWGLRLAFKGGRREGTQIKQERLPEMEIDLWKMKLGASKDRDAMRRGGI